MSRLEDPRLDLEKTGDFVDYHGSKIFVPSGHFAAEALLKGHTPEGHVYEIFREHVRPGHVVLDIGANIGFHTFPLAALVGSGGLVFAVEADIQNAAFLRQSIAKSKITNIIVLSCAASDKTGLIRMLEHDSTNNIFSERANPAETKAAVTVRMDDVIKQNVDLIKIDIEGAELLAMRGMERIISVNKPAIITEFSKYYIERTLGAELSNEYISFFLDRGYKCTYINPHSAPEPLTDINSILECQQDALHHMNWGHVDLLFSQKRT